VIDKGCTQEVLEDTVNKVLSDSIVPRDKVPKIIDRWQAPPIGIMTVPT
jgi:hypothetical protein